MDWNLATDVILLASLAVLAVFATMGLIQLIQRKSFGKVDKPILAMLVPLVAMLFTYFVFDHIFIWNTRPNGSGEPSFPSSHVMAVATIFALTALALPGYIQSKAARLTLDFFMLVLTILVAVGRVLANQHWLSDVLGALAFAAIFTLIYYLIIRRKPHVSNP